MADNDTFNKSNDHFWSTRLSQFPRWERINDYEFADVWDYEDFSLSSILVYDCTSEKLKDYVIQLLSDGFQKAQSERYIKTKNGSFLCVDMRNALQEDGSAYFFFAQGSNASEVFDFSPENFRERRIARRSGRQQKRRSRRAANRTRRRERRAERRSERIRSRQSRRDH